MLHEPAFTDPHGWAVQVNPGLRQPKCLKHGRPADTAPPMPAGPTGTGEPRSGAREPATRYAPRPGERRARIDSVVIAPLGSRSSLRRRTRSCTPWRVMPSIAAATDTGTAAAAG